MKYIHLYKECNEDYGEEIFFELSASLSEDIYVEYNFNFLFANSKILMDFFNEKKHHDEYSLFVKCEFFEDNKQREGFESFCFKVYDKGTNIVVDKNYDSYHHDMKMEMCT